VYLPASSKESISSNPKREIYYKDTKYHMEDKIRKFKWSLQGTVLSSWRGVDSKVILSLSLSPPLMLHFSLCISFTFLILPSDSHAQGRK
jgi:hypothetical protein